jgi:hypothetical protein
MNSAYWDEKRKNADSLGNILFKGFRKVITGGEIRYYKTPSLYAIVTLHERVLWFRSTPDGDFALGSKQPS